MFLLVEANFSRKEDLFELYDTIHRKITDLGSKPRVRIGPADRNVPGINH